jgi:hypothetical protein
MNYRLGAGLALMVGGCFVVVGAVTGNLAPMIAAIIQPKLLKAGGRTVHNTSSADPFGSVGKDASSIAGDAWDVISSIPY